MARRGRHRDLPGKTEFRTDEVRLEILAALLAREFENLRGYPLL
jgi:hypothetical protein